MDSTVSNESCQVIIVGAGLGGLGAALGFLRGGHRVVILESAPEIAEVRPQMIGQAVGAVC